MIRILKKYATRSRLKQPIFLVGCSKSGTTATGMLFLMHPDIGPKNVNAPVESLLDPNVFGKIAPVMEEKTVWDMFFPMSVFPQGELHLRTGKELAIYENPLSRKEEKKLFCLLTKDFKEKRFFSKGPFNSFRIHVLREIFPDAKILAIHRDGPDVIASWGDEVNRKDVMGGYEMCIPVFARKWNETIQHIETHKEELDVFTFKYEDLVNNPIATIKDMFHFCELGFIDEIYADITLGNKIGSWKARIPSEYHELIRNLTQNSRETLGYLKNISSD